MKFLCRQSDLSGNVAIPGSKSHTIRGVLLASLAAGESTLLDPLSSNDTEAAIHVYTQLGATVERTPEVWNINGVGGVIQLPKQKLDVQNSGTTLRVAMGSCSLLEAGEIYITGDKQIQRRPCGPLIDALNDLGAGIVSINENGCAPVVVKGRARGGVTTIEAKTSQYLTSLLLVCPFLEEDTSIYVPILNEKPYVAMTLDWLKFTGINVEHDNMRRFYIPANQSIKRFNRKIPADFSSATFFLVAGAIGNNSVTCTGLDLQDSQSDKAVVAFLEEMGADIITKEDSITVRNSRLTGIDIDMNDCPDALPMMAVAGCFASGTTRLMNVPHARMKETDRIAVMCKELTRLGARIEELPNGLEIHESTLTGCEVDGHYDHRVVMALTIAGLAISGTTTVNTAEAAAITLPNFREMILALEGDVELVV